MKRVWLRVTACIPVEEVIELRLTCDASSCNECKLRYLCATSDEPTEAELGKINSTISALPYVIEEYILGSRISGYRRVITQAILFPRRGY